MRKFLKNKKGFTLIELIVVIAILGILAGIAIPRFNGIQEVARVKADAATAAQMVNAARIQETNTTPGTAVTSVDTSYMPAVKPQSGGDFALSGGGSSAYVVKWTPTNAGTHNTEQTVTENTTFTLK